MLATTEPSTGDSAVQSAIRFFYVLAAMKLVGLAFGVRLLFNPTLPGGAESAMRSAVLRHASVVGTAMIVWYAVGVTLCILLGRGLNRRSRWAFGLGILYAIGHALGILAIPFFGFAMLLSGVLGMILVATLLRAENAGAFPSTG